MHFSIVAILALLGAVAVQADNKDKLFPRYIGYTMGCMKEKEATVALCKEMFQDGNDNTQAKYEPCKCTLACVAKKAGVMTDSGDPDYDKFSANVDEFDIPEWSAEWKRVRPICEPVIAGKKDCEMTHEFFTCGYKNSEVFRGVLKKFSESMEKAS